MTGTHNLAVIAGVLGAVTSRHATARDSDGVWLDLPAGLHAGEVSGDIRGAGRWRHHGPIHPPTYFFFQKGSVRGGGGNSGFRRDVGLGPAVPLPSRPGFGSRLVERGLAHGIHGTVRLLFERSGLRCEVDALVSAMR